MRVYLFIFFLILTIPLQGQTYTWTGAEEDSDFFNELNWIDPVSDEPPQSGSINPNQSINFNLKLTCDAKALNENPQFSNISLETPNIFSTTSNSSFPYVFTACLLGDGNNGQQQIFEIFVNSLPANGANYRVVKTTAGGGWYNAPQQPLVIGLNTILVSQVSFDRSVKIQFSSGSITFNSIKLNNSTIFESETYDAIVLNSSNFLEISNGTLFADKINGGSVILNENSYLNLNGSDNIINDTEINFNSGLSWLRFEKINPNSVYSHLLNQFLIDGSPGDYPSELRLDNYYENGTTIRPENFNTTPLKIFSGENLSGSEASIGLYQVYNETSIPNQMNDNIHSFQLKKGYMVTMAVNGDGTGKSQVFIASEEDLEIHSLPNFFQSGVSFIRVLPWNWVSKKGTAGDISAMNNRWFYRWNNQGNSDLSREYVPMAWGYGGADDIDDINLYKSKYKSTHIMGFNEPDDCNGQSGQYNNMCDEPTAIAVYENLMKTGLRMVSPACRQGQVFDWLFNFNQLALQNDIRMDVIALHWYDWNSNPQSSPNANPENIFNRFKNHLEEVYALYGLPIWITEFNANKYRSVEVNRQFLELAIPYLESQSFVERYSWFEPNPVEPETIGNGEFFNIDGSLTDLGTFYRNYVSNPSMASSYYTGINNLSNELLLNDYDPQCTIDNSLSINSNDIHDNYNIKVFPNPATDLIKIIISSTIKDFKMYNLNGQSIKKTPLDNCIDVSDLAAGVYFITVNGRHTKFLKR